MLLFDLVETSRLITSTSKRLEKIKLLADCLRRLAGDEIEIGVGYLSGEIRQQKLGVGYATVLASRPERETTTPEVTLTEVDRTLAAVAGVSGKGSIERRKQLLGDLLARMSAQEQSYVRRLLLGELRQGALAGLMIDALARAAQVATADVRRAAMLAGGIAPIATSAMTEGQAGLQRYTLRLFHAVTPMLAQPAQDMAEAMRQLGTAALEWKLDGARIQVHKHNDEVRIYSRGMNDVSVAVPEIVEAVRALDADALILDGEAIALREDARPHPFQITMRRFGRRLDVSAMRETLPLSAFFFDCLRLRDSDLIDRPYLERLAALAQIIPDAMRIPGLITDDVDAAQLFFDQALQRGHEGVMAKSPHSLYEAGNRGSSWLKIKSAHTLDLVILAAEWGSGRRRGWLSNLHLGARDPVAGTFIMLGKTFKGLTDAMLEWQTQKLLELETSRDAIIVYVRPEVVVEIAVNEIQNSAQYPGGLALRFARVKAYRTDKRPDEADTIDSVRALFTHHTGAPNGEPT
ncbi:MAG: ATP-dependent DNA ligase [Betaproteobacteria bacterium]